MSNNVPHSTDPTCAMPQRLAGLKFANLQVDEFACPPELLSAPRYVEANVGKCFEFCYIMFMQYLSCYITSSVDKDLG